MWRKSDLHRHTSEDKAWKPIEPAAVVAACLADHLDVVAITDHDRLDQVGAVRNAAAMAGLEVVPGVEISTDRGHVLALSPGGAGLEVLQELALRVGAKPSTTVDFHELVRVVGRETRQRGEPYRDSVVLVAAHVDQPKSLLAVEQPLRLEAQLRDAESLPALDVVSLSILQEWTKSGVKNSPVHTALIQSSDAHASQPYAKRFAWLYLPEMTAQSLRHAFATFEASVVCGSDPLPEAEFWIRAVRFEGGMFDGRRFEFSPRVTAIIGPPSSGKSLILDAVRFAFGGECGIEEVQLQTEHRFAKCLPDGSIVTVEIEESGKAREIQRVRGGAAPRVETRQPLSFGQTELTRRAMEKSPSMALVDMHCEGSSRRVSELNRLQTELTKAVDNAFTLAADSRELRREVENPQDGLSATRAVFGSLAGSEAAAINAQQLTVVERWRQQARSKVREWRESFSRPAGPSLPQQPRPKVPLKDELADFLISRRIEEIVSTFGRSVVALAQEAADSIAALLDETDKSLAATRARIEKELGQQIGTAEAVVKRVQQLRDRLGELEDKSARLVALDAAIDEALAGIDGLIGAIDAERLALRADRGATCRAVNGSMRDFFARLGHGVRSERLEELLDELKTGTNYRSDTLTEIAQQLDRKRLVRCAVREIQQIQSAERWAGNESSVAEKQDRIAVEAAGKQRMEALSLVAGLWPGDSLELMLRVHDGSPTPFEELTEGLRALAIKEVSFASSAVPVVTDQPEDAVPTASVFENLVPTLRGQRATRQFIIASHDANIVVAGDVERVVVLSGNGGEARVGTLFEGEIRDKSLMHLEGGEKAFRVRQRKYGEML